MTKCESNSLLQKGQIVRVEVGFRILPAGPVNYIMRTMLKNVVIIQNSITAVRCCVSTMKLQRVNPDIQTMAFIQADAEKEKKLMTKQSLSIASAGPSGIVISQPKRKRVKRAAKMPTNVEKSEEKELDEFLDSAAD